MSDQMNVKVGDYYYKHGCWHEVLAMGVVQNETVSGNACVRIALPTYNNGCSIHTTTHFEGEEQAHKVMTKRDMDKSIENGYEYSSPVYTASIFASFLGKPNYGTLEDFGNKVIQSEREFWNGNVKDWIAENEVIRECVNDYALRLFIANVYRPFTSTLTEGNISITRNAGDAERDRQTSMKPGRAFRHMFPFLDDKDLARITEAWLEHSAPRVLTLKVGNSASAFKRAYDHTRSAYRNPSTTHGRKSIASSCMQGVCRSYYDYSACESATASVGEAYASGDFTVAWCETPDGFIAGRVVYSDVDGVPHYNGPLYGACEQSLDMLQSHLDDIDSGLDVDEWDGLKFLVVGSYDDPIVPYIDGELSGTLTRCNKFITLSTGGGEFEFDSTEGYTTGGESCCECGDRTDEDSTFFTDDGPMCECCFDRNYIQTSDGETLHHEDACLVNSKTYYGFSSEYVANDDAAFCESVDEWWHIDDVTYTEDGDECVPTHMMDQFPDLFPAEVEDELEEAA